MAYVDPSFEQRRKSILGGTPQAASSGGGQPMAPTTGSAFSDPAFEQRRQQIVSTPQKPVSTEPVKVVAAKQVEPTFGQRVSTTIKGIDFKKLGSSLIAGVKQLPGQVVQSGGILIETLSKQKQAMDTFFGGQQIAKAITQQLTGKKITTYDEKARDIEQQIALQLRETGTQKQTDARKAYEETYTPSTGLQGYLESAAFNIPQMAVTTALSLATTLITRNPAAGAAVGLSTAYSMGASEVYQSARDKGLEDNEALPLATAGGAIIGAIDYLPLGRLLRKSGVAKPAIETIQKSIISKLASGVVDIGIQAGFEGITEGMQEIVGNVVKRTYVENQNILEGVKESAIVGALLGGFADVTVSGAIGALERTAQPKEVLTNIEQKIQGAIDTDPQERTPEQQAVVDTLFTQELSADEAAAYVMNNNLEKTDEGREIMKVVVEAKQTDQMIKLSPDPTESGINIDLVAQPSRPPDELPSTQGPSPTVVEDGRGAGNARIEELKTAYNTKRNEVENALSEVLMELEVAEAGKRIFLDNPESGSQNVIGIKSTFPQWVPEDLRSKDLFNKVLEPLANFIDNPVFPPASRPRQRELINLLLDTVDERAGINTSDIRNAIMSNEENKAEAIETSRGTDRGTQGSERSDNPFDEEVKQEAAPSEEKMTPVSEIKSNLLAGKTPQQKPITTAEIPHVEGESRLQERVAAQILDQNGEKYDFEPESGKYNKITLEGDAQKAIDFLQENPKQALKVARGLAEAPEGQTANNIAMAAALKARDEGNIELFTELITKTSLRSTRFGQEIVTLRGNFNENTPEHWVKRLLDTRINNLGKGIVTEAEKALGKAKSAKAKAIDRIDSEVNMLSERMKKERSKIDLAQKIIDSLICT